VIMSGRPTPPENPQPERFPLLAFAVDDLDATLEVLQQHAVDLPWGVEHNPQARWVMFYDPAGNLLELVQFA
jgi:predicted enzyme related to lactoylglutathione lyase